MSAAATLPSGWTRITLDEACEKIQDGTHFSPKTQYTERQPGLFRYVTAKNVREGGIILDEINWIDAAAHKAIYTRCDPRPGDVLLIKDGVKAGVAGINQLNEPFSLLSSVALIRPRRQILLPPFVKYFLNAPTGRGLLLGKMTGTAIRRIVLEAVKSTPIPIPPVAEQRRITEKLDALLSDLDAAIATLNRAVEKLKRYRQAVLKAAVEGNLSHEWRETHPESLVPAAKRLARVLLERRKKWEDEHRSVPKGADARRGLRYVEPQCCELEELPDLPPSWPYANLDIMSQPSRDALKTGPFGMALGKEDYRDEGVPIIGIENISSGRFTPGFKKFVTSAKYASLVAYSLGPGDIVVSRSGTVGEVCVIPEKVTGLMSTNLIRIRVDTEVVDPAFVALVFRGSKSLDNQLSELCSGSTRDFLNHPILRSLALPLPPLGEQGVVVARVEELEAALDAMEQGVQHDLRRAARLRQSILEKAFRGELVPQDPSDEPASFLLERIRAERAAAAKTKPVRSRKPRAKGAPAAQ